MDYENIFTTKISRFTVFNLWYCCFFLDRVKQKFEEYEYDEAVEPSYRSSLFKMFNKTLSDGFFPLIIVDAPNHKVRVCVLVHVVCTCQMLPLGK